jgi:hypothetical protein
MMAKNDCFKMTIAIAGVFLLLAISSAHAAPVIQADGTTVTGVKGLNVLGTDYNVTWALKTASQVYGGVYPVTTEGSAKSVLEELNDLLNGPGFVGPTGPDFENVRADDNADYKEYYLAYATGNDGKANYVSTLVKFQVGWDTEPDADDIGRDTVPPVPFAVLTPVPIPAAVWLLGGGLIGLLGLRRKFRN